jgi:hypothetical protein
MKPRTLLRGISAAILIANAGDLPAGAWQNPKPTPIVTRVEGRQIPWIMRVTQPWLGGNVYQLEALIRTGKLDFLEIPVRDLKNSAADKDAVIVHMLDLQEYAKKQLPVSTEVIVIYSSENLADLFRKDFKSAWRNVTQTMVEPRYPTKSHIEILVAENPEQTGGFTTFRAVFRVATPRGEELGRVMHFVDLKSNGMHLFMLAGAASRMDDRYSEFLSMLKSVRYNLPQPNR